MPRLHYVLNDLLEDRIRNCGFAAAGPSAIGNRCGEATTAYSPLGEAPPPPGEGPKHNVDFYGTGGRSENKRLLPDLVDTVTSHDGLGFIVVSPPSQ